MAARRLWVSVPKGLFPEIWKIKNLAGFAPARSDPNSFNYRFAVPRANFFTLRLAEPRAYSRGFRGFSVARFLRAVRFDFLRSSLLSAFVFAIYMSCPITAKLPDGL